MAMPTTGKAGKPVVWGATASLVYGVLALFLLWILAAIPAIAFGHYARRTIREEPGAYRGARRALAGLISGYLSLLGTPVVWLLLIATLDSEDSPPKHVPAKNYATQLSVAVNAYFTEYGNWPFTTASNSGDEEVDNRTFLDALRGADFELNRRRVVFIEVPPQFIKNGQMVDPWGNPYHIALDTNGDGMVALGSEKIARRSIVWSNGKNGRDEQGGGDDVKTWEEGNGGSSVGR